MLKVGIIGYGKMGQTRARAISASGVAFVKSIWDVNTPTGSDYGIASSDQAILGDPELDAVFVCTPNFRIVSLTVAALRAGKHVFAEKPPAFTANEFLQVLEAEKDSGKLVMYGFNHRHHGSIIRMKEIISSGEMGRILWVRGRYGKEVDESFLSGWRADPKLSGGGIMLDQGIHMLDLFLHLAGEFDEVHALVSSLFWKIPGIEDNVFAIMRSSQSGVCASLHSTMTQWRYLFSLEVFLEKGSLVLNGLKTSSGAYGDEDLAIRHTGSGDETGHVAREERIVYHNDTSWESEIGHFFDSINNKTKVQTGNTTDALILMRLLDRIYAHKTPVETPTNHHD
tara:strand:+ start:1843 stop:2862 length:1020 start_codon:yes stop_codon:yes gene_type:complete